MAGCCFVVMELHSVNVPSEAAIFLCSIGAVLIILVIFFFYLNKLLCFTSCGGLPCLEEQTQKSQHNKLGKSYAYHDESSSDSEEEAIRQYKVSVNRSSDSKNSPKSSDSKRSPKSTDYKRSPVKNGSTQETRQGTEEHNEGSTDDSITLEQGQDNVAYYEPTDSDSDVQLHSDNEGIKDDNRGDSESLQLKLPASSRSSSQVSPSDKQHSVADNEAFIHEGLSPSDSQTATDATWSITHSKSTDENLFDVSDLQLDPPLISKCGSLEVLFRYDNVRNRLTVVIIQAREIPSKERGGANSSQVRLILLPSRKQKYKTKIKTGDNPVFDEKFVFSKLNKEELREMGVRVRLYGLERMRRERMIGESVIRFTSLNLEDQQTFWVVLEPRSNISVSDSKTDISSLSRSDSGSSVQSLQHGGMPELLLGLAYNGTTGRLSIEVIKGSNFRNMATNRAPDTYVKLTLMSPSGQEVSRSKTSVRRGQPNPLFRETFVFQVAQFQLNDVTLLTSVYNKRSMKKKEMIGWFALGLNSSGEEEKSHWSDMRDNKGDQVCRWHLLLES